MRGISHLLLAAIASLGFCLAATARAQGETASSQVSYFRAATVAQSFERGAVLYNPGDTNYMVHTSRRTMPGMAEVHALDTDIIYVLEGSATFVTGGQVVDGKSTASDEVRGVAIDGGETRVLAPGDVIIVPHGTPHWFKEIQGPVLYYTIKVR